MKQPTYISKWGRFPYFGILNWLIGYQKSQQNYCCPEFKSHVTISSQASVIPKSFIIKQSRGSHNMIRFAAGLSV